MPKTEKCGQPLAVERYGGGLRYHCPDCDVNKGRHYMMTTATWTNAAPPKDRLCPNKVRTHA
jgi:hypothetical protein